MKIGLTLGFLLWSAAAMAAHPYVPAPAREPVDGYRCAVSCPAWPGREATICVTHLETRQGPGGTFQDCNGTACFYEFGELVLPPGKTGVSYCTAVFRPDLGGRTFYANCYGGTRELLDGSVFEDSGCQYPPEYYGQSSASGALLGSFETKMIRKPTKKPRKPGNDRRRLRRERNR